MSVLGFNDLKQFALPTGWDAGEISKYSLVDGTSLGEIYNTAMAGSLAIANELLAHPIYGGLVSVTSEQGREYRDGGTNVMQERTEYSKPDPQRGKTIGHMYPIKSYDRGLGFTMDFLRKARIAQIDANLSDAYDAVRNTFQIAVLTRAFSDTENLMGSSGYDVPFVKTGGNVTFTPPNWGGFTHTSSHTHYDRKATNAHATALEDGVKELWHHGITGPYLAIVPFADRSTYTALTNFRAPRRNEVTYSTSANLALVNEEVFFGVYETALGVVYLHASNRVPTNYLGIFKSYGTNDPRNPLAVRVSPDYLFTPILLGDNGFKISPMENMQLIHEYGVGVQDRLAAYLCYFAASGDYTKPTIS